MLHQYPQFNTHCLRTDSHEYSVFITRLLHPHNYRSLFHPDTKSHFCTSICLPGVVAPFSSPHDGRWISGAAVLGRGVDGQRQTVRQGGRVRKVAIARNPPSRPPGMQRGAQNMNYDSIWAAQRVYVYLLFTTPRRRKLIGSAEQSRGSLK